MLARTTKILTLSLPPEMLKEVEKIAKEENRTRSELFREALRQYISSKERWRKIRKWGTEFAREQKLTEADIERIVDEVRSKG